MTLADGTALPADGVVLALPPQRVAAACPAALPRDPGLGASPIVNVHVWYDRPVMDEPFTAVVDSPVQWIFNRTAMGGGDGASHHLAISISGARDEVDVPRAELAEAMSAELAVLLPRARAARILDTAVVKEPQATFAQAPGQAARRPGHGDAAAGRGAGRRVDRHRVARDHGGGRAQRHRRRPARHGAAAAPDSPCANWPMTASANWHAGHGRSVTTH